MRRIAAVAIVVAIAFSACGSDVPEGAVRVVIADGSSRIVVVAEVAATPEQRATGLMNRDELPDGRGMLFVFPRPTRGGFWMKNTLVPLRILFIRDGVVVEVREMQPCREDPCPLTVPAVEYDQALEVALTTLEDIGPGARVDVEGRLPSAA